jgi:hypothetical protein
VEAGAELNISNDFIWPLHQPENGTIVVFWFERTSVSGEFPNACVLTEATQWIRNGK